LNNSLSATRQITDAHDIFTNMSVRRSEIFFSYIMEFGNTMPEHTLNQALAALLEFQKNCSEKGRSYILVIRE